jgi:hypothetical protein
MSRFHQTIYLVGLFIVILYGVYFIYKRKEPFQDILNEVQQPSIPSSQQSNTPGVSTLPSNIVIPEVSVSGTAYDAMSLQQRSQILRDIQNAVKNEILTNRQTQVPQETSGQSQIEPSQSQQNISNAIQQGQEYKSCKACPTNPDGSCPPIPDMSQYIRKDQIPCWNCTLDY